MPECLLVTVTAVTVAGHLMIVRARAGTSWHLAERATPEVSKCGVTGTRFTPVMIWLPGAGACERCRRIVGAEGFTHVVDDLDGHTTEL